MKRFLEQWIGANWRSTISGIGSSVLWALSMLALMPYDFGAVADFFPPQAKKWVALTGAASGFALKVVNSLVTKDSKVTGNGTAEIPYEVREGGESHEIAPKTP